MAFKSMTSICLDEAMASNRNCNIIFPSQWLEARERFQKAAELMQAEQRMRKSMWGQFWSSHQRFFKYLCIAAKVRHVVKLAREAVKIGKVSNTKKVGSAFQRKKKNSYKRSRSFS